MAADVADALELAGCIDGKAQLPSQNLRLPLHRAIAAAELGSGGISRGATPL